MKSYLSYATIKPNQKGCVDDKQLLSDISLFLWSKNMSKGEPHCLDWMKTKQKIAALWKNNRSLYLLHSLLHFSFFIYHDIFYLWFASQWGLCPS